MNRKTFLKKSAGAALILIPSISLLGCSSSSDDNEENQGPGKTANCLDNGTTSSIGSNHGHAITVSKADVEAGTEKTYTIQGTSGHNHSVTLSSANFTSLKSNTAISVNSTNDDGHTHAISISCA